MFHSISIGLHAPVLGEVITPIWSDPAATAAIAETRAACHCADESRLPSGSGIVIAALCGIVGLAGGVAVWVSGAGWGWALLAWIVAGPLALAVYATLSVFSRGNPAPCQPERCRSGWSRAEIGALSGWPSF